MSIVEFDTRNCRFCNEAILGKWLANCSLPLGKKIITIDRFSGDPRNEFLKIAEEEFGGYMLPMYLITERRPLVVISVLNCHHLKTFFKEYFNII